MTDDLEARDGLLEIADNVSFFLSKYRGKLNTEAYITCKEFSQKIYKILIEETKKIREQD